MVEFRNSYEARWHRNFTARCIEHFKCVESDFSWFEVNKSCVLLSSALNSRNISPSAPFGSCCVIGMTWMQRRSSVVPCFKIVAVHVLPDWESSSQVYVNVRSENTDIKSPNFRISSELVKTSHGQVLFKSRYCLQVCENSLLPVQSSRWIER